MKESRRIYRRSVVPVLLAGLILFLIGCEKNATQPPDQKMEVSPAAAEGLVSGWQTMHSIAAAGEVDQLVSGDAPVEKTDLGGIYSKQQLQKEISKMEKGLAQAIPERGFSKPAGEDSLLWFVDWTNPANGYSIRKAFYYNNATGRARYYEAIYRFPPQLQLVYDSTEIRVDLNFTLNNSSDDKFLSLSKLSRFKDEFYVNRIESIAQATDYGPNNEVIGAVLHNNVRYNSQNQLDSLAQEFELNPDESGHIFERLAYRDGTYLQKTVNLYADYTGDFSETWRNGTTVAGTFDRIEDDNHAAFTKTITFPSGHNPAQIEQKADVTLNPADSSGYLLLNEKVHFANGRLDTSQLNIDEYYENGLKNTHLEAANSNGSHADLLVTHNSEYDEVQGNYIGPLGHFSLVHAILYQDGSGELWLKVYASEEAYNNGEPPLVDVYIHFNPDGSGAGNYSEADAKYQVNVNQGGQMTVSDQKGNQQVVAGY